MDLDFKSFCYKWLFHHTLTLLKLKPEYAERTRPIPRQLRLRDDGNPDSKVYGTNMGPIWGRQDPSEPHVGPMNCAIWVNGYFNAALNTDWLLLTVQLIKLICRKNILQIVICILPKSHYSMSLPIMLNKIALTTLLSKCTELCH